MNPTYPVGSSGYTEGPNSFFGDPQFVDYRRHEAWDFQLLPTSSATDTGDPNLGSLFNLPDPFLDLDGAIRPIDIPGVGHEGAGAYDIGAYEYQDN